MRVFATVLFVLSFVFMALLFEEHSAVAMIPPQMSRAEPDQDSVECMALNMYHEARGEGEIGMIAVGNVVLNRVGNPKYGLDVCSVVKQGHYRRSWKNNGAMVPVRGRCAFSWHCDGRSDEAKDRTAYARAEHLAKKLLRSEIEDLTGGATHYHKTTVTPNWGYVQVAHVGDHIFYKGNK